jgi:hypothetical protein
MPYVGKTPSLGNFVKLDAISVVNGQASYTMQNGGANFTEYSNVNQFLVSLNGILQSPTDSFTVSGSTITFASNLVTGDVIDFIIVLGNSLDVGVPSDNTVSLAKLTATGTKDATTFLRGDNTFAEAGGGSLVKLQSTTLSSTNTFITFDSTIITSTYDAYYFTILASPETDNAYLQLRLSDGGTFNSGASDYGYAYINDSGTGTSSNGASEIRIFDQTDSAFANAYQGELTLFYPQNSSVKTVVNYKGQRNDGDPALMNGGGQRLTAEANDGIQFFFSSGDISVGSTITCYGIEK